MNQLERTKKIIELGLTEARLDELNRSKLYFGQSSTYYRNRLRTLEEKKESLENELSGNVSSSAREIVLQFNLPASTFAGKEKMSNENVLQFLKREFLVRE